MNYLLLLLLFIQHINYFMTRYYTFISGLFFFRMCGVSFLLGLILRFIEGGSNCNPITRFLCVANALKAPLSSFSVMEMAQNKIYDRAVFLKMPTIVEGVCAGNMCTFYGNNCTEIASIVSMKTGWGMKHVQYFRKRYFIMDCSSCMKNCK